jgi:hypothetical protein
MAHAFTQPDVIDSLRGNVAHPTYQFVELQTQEGYKSFFLTNFTDTVPIADVPTVLNDQSGKTVWSPDYLDGVSAPARTGEVSQEVQRIQFKQALDYQFTDASEDLVTALGAFHNGKVVVTAYVFSLTTNEFLHTDPVYRTYGLIKSVSRSTDDGGVVIETTSSFGKLNNVKELVTTPASLHKYTFGWPDPTFDNAGTKHDRQALEWGTG